MTVERLLSEMSSAEIGEWIAFYRIEPFGSVREDLRAGEIAAAVVNVSGAAKEAYRPRDFFPDTLDARSLQARNADGTQSIEEQKMILSVYHDIFTIRHEMGMDT